MRLEPVEVSRDGLHFADRFTYALQGFLWQGLRLPKVRLRAFEEWPVVRGSWLRLTQGAIDRTRSLRIELGCPLARASQLSQRAYACMEGVVKGSHTDLRNFPRWASTVARREGS